MSISIITPPDPETPPIALNLLKSHLSMLPLEVDFDELIKMYLGAAVEEFESRTKRAIISRVVRQTFDCFPCEDFFCLECAPLLSLSSIQYRNDEGNFVTLSADVYSYDIIETNPIIQLKVDQVWPEDIDPYGFNCVRVNYTAGYGADESDVPMDIKRSLSMLVGDSYLNREDSLAIPGVSSVFVSANSYQAMKKFRLNYFEHRSQKRR
jgi:uncharacterized phiE125 gp8 family phage protein